MVQVKLLSGKRAGAQWEVRRFPARIGRAASNDIRLEEDGVWDRHFELNLDPADGFVLNAQPDALVTVNHQSAQKARLRNGDSIEFGSVRLQFWLGETRQRGLRLREGFVWTIITVISAAQVALVYRLLF